MIFKDNVRNLKLLKLHCEIILYSLMQNQCKDIPRFKIYSIKHFLMLDWKEGNLDFSEKWVIRVVPVE